MKFIEKMELAGAGIVGLLALACFVLPIRDANMLFDLSSMICLVSAAALWHDASHTGRGIDLACAFLTSVLAVLMCFHRLEGRRFVVGLFAFYMLFSAVLYIIQFGLDTSDHSQDAWISMVEAVLFGIVFLMTLLFRHWDFVRVQYVVGAYLLVQAVQMMLEVLYFHTPKATRAWTWRTLSGLPVYIFAVLPSWIEQRHASMQARHILAMHQDQAEPCQKDNSFSSSPEKEDLLEVIVESTAEKGRSLQTLSFAYKGVLYGYGNFDPESGRGFHSAAPGVVVTVPDQLYCDLLEKAPEDAYIRYGIRLEKEQRERLESLLKRLYRQTYRWYCPIEKRESDPEVSLEQMSDRASLLSWLAGAKFRKFYHGRWKTFWLHPQRSALFACDLLYQVNPAIIGTLQIPSADEVLCSLEHQQQKKNSPVIFLDCSKRKRTADGGLKPCDK